MSYTQKAITGFTWQGALKILITITTAVKISVLARILTPEDFGLFAIVAIALGVSESVTQTGVNYTILQSRHSTAFFLNTAWVIAIIRGFLIGIIMILLGMLTSYFFNNSALSIMTSLAALVPVIKGFINPSIVSFHKQLKFFQDSLYRLSLNVVDVIFAIILAIILKSVYALIFGMIIAAIYEVVISFIFIQEKPIFVYLPSRAKEIFKNTKWLSLSTIFNYFNENIDDFLLGKILGTHLLGIYHKSYQLSHKVNYEISQAIHHANLPIYSQINHHQERIKKAFIKTFLVTLILSIGFSLPLLFFPNLIVNILLGDQWLEAIPLIRPLVLAGIVQSMSLCCYTLLLGTKKLIPLNIHSLLTLILMVSLILILSQRQGSAVDAVIGIFIARLVTLPILFWSIKNILFD